MKPYMKTSPYRSLIQFRFRRSKEAEWKLFEYLEQVAREEGRPLNETAKQFLLDAIGRDIENR
jgi:hypothetical protein